jgi:hypothetical protein
MIKSAFDKRGQCVLARMPTWTMTAVVTESDGFGERDIESEWASHRCCNLSNFNGMSEASSLVIVWKHKNLGFAGETSKR